MHCHPTFYSNLPRREGILIAKARLYIWTSCNWYLKQIGQRHCVDCVSKPDYSTCLTCEACDTCKVKDDMGHVLNNCKKHEESRSLTLIRIKEETAKITDLITNENATFIKELGRFLVEIDESRSKVKENNKTTNRRRKPLKQMTPSRS